VAFYPLADLFSIYVSATTNVWVFEIGIFVQQRCYKTIMFSGFIAAIFTHLTARRCL